MVRVGVGVGVSTSIPGILTGVYFSWSLYSTVDTRGVSEITILPRLKIIF